MRVIQIAEAANAEGLGLPKSILDVNRKNRPIIITEAEYDAIPTSGVLADEITDLGPFFLTELQSVSVTVPSITDPDIAKVDVDVASAFTASVTTADFVIVNPTEALPTNCRLQGAYISGTDTVTIVYGSEGGNVTGAAKAHNILVLKQA